MKRAADFAKATAVIVALCAAAAVSPAQTLTTLHSFCSPIGPVDNCDDGTNPFAALVQASDGNLYGTTSQGGPGYFGAGAIFKITLDGALTTLGDFCAGVVLDHPILECPGGAFPSGALVQAGNGNLYGTTANGGLQVNGGGTIFQIAPSGAVTALYVFCSQNGCPEGRGPSGLVQANDGNLYGTTAGGTIFRITLSGTLTVLYRFSGTDGVAPATLVQASDGDLYGTTGGGGAYGSGTTFKITLAGALTTLYSFCSQGGTACTDGNGPNGALVQASDGNFYGTTAGGGAYGSGTVFKITPGGALSTLYSFCAQGGNACADGASPNGPLIQAKDGNLYGTTREGGANGEGTVFRLTPSGALTTLYSFCNLSVSQAACADGETPYAGLIQANDGYFYGTTAGGGLWGSGTVFRLSTAPPSGPSIIAGGVVNAASYATGASNVTSGLTPGSIASAFGYFLLNSTAAAPSVPLPDSLSGLGLEFAGGLAAPLYYVSGGQVNLQVPWELAGQSQGTLQSLTTLVATVNGQTGPPQTVWLTFLAPGIFSTNAQGTGQGAILNTSYQLVDASNPATVGDYILIYCTGLGPVTNQPATGAVALSDPLSWTTTTPTVTIGRPGYGIPASVQFSGLAPGFVGLYQVNAQVPAGVAPGPAVPVVISTPDSQSNAVTIAVK